MTTYLDRRFRGVGRIKKATGTEHKPTIRLLSAMLTGLFERGRLDILKSIQKGELSPLQVWEFYRINELEKLPTAQTMGDLSQKMYAWIEDKECSDAHRRSLHQSLRHILAVAKRSVAVADLPELLTTLRAQMKGDTHARSFNLSKAAAQAFLKSTLKRSHSLYHEVTAIEPLKVTAKRTKHPLTPEEFAALTEAMPARARAVAVAMAYTGMGWSEYTGHWNVHPDRIQIFGTKRKGRKRLIPTPPRFPHVVTMSYKVFRAELAKASGGTVRPYDLRRTYANWLEAAGVPRTRRKMYLGHGASDVTDLYERHEVERFLAEDAERLRRFVGATEKSEEVPRLKLEKA